MSRSLAGKRILLTREKGPSEQMAADIRRYGGDSVIVPVMKIVPNTLSASVRQTIRKANQFDWIIFTSSNGVKAFMEQWKALGTPLLQPKIAAVGSKTAHVLKDYGLAVQIMPSEFTAESLASRFSDINIQGAKVLLPLGNLAKTDLEDRLKQAGCLTERINVYNTAPNEEIEQELVELVQSQTIDVVTFASPSAIEFFLTMTEGIDLHDFWTHTHVACIGKVSADFAKSKGLAPRIVPKTFTARALVEAIAHFYNKN